MKKIGDKRHAYKLLICFIGCKLGSLEINKARHFDETGTNLYLLDILYVAIFAPLPVEVADAVRLPFATSTGRGAKNSYI